MNSAGHVGEALSEEGRIGRRLFQHSKQTRHEGLASRSSGRGVL